MERHAERSRGISPASLGPGNKAGEVNLYTFNTFDFFSRTIGCSRCLRLVLGTPSPLESARNYHGGGNPNAESGRDARPAVISLYHDAKHASVLEMPVAKKSAGTAAR